MSKAYGKTTIFSTNFDFMSTAQRNFVFIVTKQLLHFCLCGEIKNNTCMVNRQRQSKITQKGSEMGSFSGFASVLQITFLNNLPNVVPHHVFVILSLVTMFKVQYILMKVIALLL